VNNLIGKSKHYISGRLKNFSLWVKVICDLPKSTLNSLGCSVKFKGIDRKTHKLEEFVIFDNSGNSSINYDDLLNSLLTPGRRNPSFVADMRSFLEMLFEQSKTNLPGIAYLSISKTLELIHKISISDLKQLWKDVIIFTSKAIVSRKSCLESEQGLIASIHSLTFPSLNLKRKHEVGKISAKKVDFHYFYYGEKDGERIFNLSLHSSKSVENRKRNKEKTIQLFKDGGIKYVDSCYFPELKDDFLLNISCWQVWWNLINDKSRNFTIGHLYQEYLEEAGIFNIESNATVPDAFSLELLAHWSICYASHKDLNGFASAPDVMKEFIINVQSCYYEEPFETGNDDDAQQLIFNFEPLPMALLGFLENFSVPYLVQSDAFTSNFSKFIRMGKSDRLENSVGWDVNFDLFFGNVSCKGYIECKLLSTAIGLPNLLPYYKKAGIGGHKISLLLAKSVQVSMQGEAATKKLITKSSSNEIQDKNAKKVLKAKKEKIIKTEPTRTRKSVTNYIELYEELWKDPQNKYNINLYSVILDSNTNYFKFGVLKEFENPTGVFILVQTNFEPQRSAYN